MSNIKNIRNTRNTESIKNIRNFTIIAHIDHGKSTLADRMLQICGAVDQRDFHNQMLDQLSLEKEKGITIKSATVRLNYIYEGEEYVLNLCDTPGHVDFTYEVSRSLAGCEISLLLVDATQGMQAQTMSNLEKAKAANHFIIPVINKIDAPGADIDRCLNEMMDRNVDISNACYVSAKTGEGVENLIQLIIKLGPCPVENEKKLIALVIDSWYNKYLGVSIITRIFGGKVKKGDEIQMKSNGKTFEVVSVGYFLPGMKESEYLCAGELGYIVTQIKDPKDIRIGDTLVEINSDVLAIEGFKPSIPMVYCTFYPQSSDLAEKTKVALAQYQLNDAAFTYEYASSSVYGLYFNCGFLGLLHLQIVKERLEREFDVKVIPGIPSVSLIVHLKNKKVIEVKDAEKMPEAAQIDYIEEPQVKIIIITQGEYYGIVLELCKKRRGENFEVTTEDNKLILTCFMPLSEVIVNFYDILKKSTKGYSSFDYEIIGFMRSDLCKVLVLINSKQFKEFNMIIHRDKAREVGVKLAEKLKDIIPRSQVKIIIQIAIENSSNIIARATLNPYMKNVISGCSGGDKSRQKKLTNNQAEGKSKMNALFNSRLSSDDIAKMVIGDNIQQLIEIQT